MSVPFSKRGLFSDLTGVSAMQEKRNQWDLSFFYLSVLIYPLNVLLSAFLRVLGFHYFASKTIFMAYAVLFMIEGVIFIRFPISLKRLSSLFLIYFLYIFLYLTSPKEIQYRYLEVDMLMIYSLYLPYAVLIVSRVKDFSPLFSSQWADFLNGSIIVLSFLVKFLLHDETGYMTYSYNLLPVWILFSFGLIRQPNPPKVVVALVMLLEGVIYGARGPLIWLGISVLGYLLLHRIASKKKVAISFKSMIRVLIGMVAIAGFGFVFMQVLSRVNVPGSYILHRIDKGVLTESTGRSAMVDTAFHYLGQMGLSFNGMFFDRTIMPDHLYVHNLFLETLLGFGWVFGSLILVTLFAFIGRIFFKANMTQKKVVLFLTASFFLKYFLTGSMYDDYTFIIFLAAMYAVYRQASPERLVIYESTDK